MLKGIDISRWQGITDFNKLKLSQQFIIIRSSYGNGYTDQQFNRNRDECRRLQIPRGFYHYSYPQYNSAQAEADWFLKVVGTPQAGEWLVLDFEERYAGNTVQWCYDFLNYIKDNLNGYKAVIYLNLSQTKSYNWKPIIDDGYGLWLAYYNQNPNAPVPITPWAVVAMRQWSSIQHYDGIAGAVDANVFYGTLTAFPKYGYQPPPPPPLPPPPVLNCTDYERISKETKNVIDSGDNDQTKVSKIREITANVKP